MSKIAKIEQMIFESDIVTVPSTNYPSVYPMHWHQYVECIAIMDKESTAVVSINQKPLTMSCGDIIFVWPGELHEIIDNNDKSIVALQFPLSLINSKKDFAACYTLYRDNNYLKYEANPALNSVLLDKNNNILRIASDSSDKFRSIKMTLMLYEMFIEIATSVQQIAKTSNSIAGENNQVTDKINLACSYITNHCTENLTLEKVASFVGFSSCYFSRHFKRITTHSFVEYLILQRINRLQVLLTDNSVSITDAAYQAGFRSISTLNRAFSKYCGCSPRDFRNYLSR